MFLKKITKEMMLESVCNAIDSSERIPASKPIIQLHDIFVRFQSAHENDRDPSKEELDVYFGEMIVALEGILDAKQN